MSDNHGKFEKVFDVAAPRERVWQAFTEPGVIEAWLAKVAECDISPGGRIAFEPDEFGGQLLWDITDVEPERRLAYREGPGILPVETEVTVMFEAIDTGTRLTITQAGFGPGDDWQGLLDDVGLGWAQTLAALELYLRTGVRYDRFFTFRSDAGVVVRDSLAGPEVLSVMPGSFADKAGVRAGDIILQIGTAPVFGRAEIWLLTREHEAGEEFEVVYVRGRELRRGQAALSSPMG